jgi:hypothetical protein
MPLGRAIWVFRDEADAMLKSGNLRYFSLTVFWAAHTLHVPVAAQQTHFGSHGIFTIYREERSCTLYADFPSGTMMRLSDRRDEGRAYVNFVNRAWRAVPSGTLTMTITFPELGRGHATAAQVISFDDGRRGYAGGDLANADLLADFSSSDVMLLSTARNGPAVEQERFNITGSAEAFRMMRRCSSRYFPPGQEGGAGNDTRAIDAQKTGARR